MSILFNSVTEKFGKKVTEKIFEKGTNAVRRFMTQSTTKVPIFTPATLEHCAGKTTAQAAKTTGTEAAGIIPLEKPKIPRRPKTTRTHQAPKPVAFKPANPTATTNLAKPLLPVRPLSKTQIKLNQLKVLRANLENLIQRDERGVITSTNEECRNILPRLNGSYLKKAGDSFRIEQELSMLPKGHPMRTELPLKTQSSIKLGLGYPTPRDLINRYVVMLENNIGTLQHEVNCEQAFASFKTETGIEILKCRYKI